MSATITLPGTLDSLYPLLDFVSSYAGQQGFDREKINRITLALEEVLVNIIKYAYKSSQAGGDIEITCRLTDGRDLIMEIVDSGMPFNILSARDPDVNANIDERPIGGLGIYFVKQLMDDVRYIREEGRNKLELVVRNAG